MPLCLCTLFADILLDAACGKMQGIMPLVVWTNSESGKNVGMMQGLSRHLDVWVMLVQHHKETGRLVVRCDPAATV